jgi:FtsH-binding integral membrane protein
MDTRSISRAQPAVAYDEGLRAFMIGTYNKLGLGVLITAVFAWLTGSTPLGEAFFRHTPKGIDYTALGFLVAFGPLALILLMGFVFKNTNSRAGSGFLYYASTVMFGLSSGVLVQLYTGASLGLTLAITATMFGGLSLYGYTTKRDFTAIGGFLLAALLGLIVMMIVSIFVPGLNFLVTIAGILLFSVFIAYDTQRLKFAYSEVAGSDEDTIATAQNMAAFNLFLDILNLFQFLLQLFGVRKD